MSYAEKIRKLTEDPGANELARIVDQLQAQVNACCGGGGLNNAAAGKTPSPPAVRDTDPNPNNPR